MTKFKTFEERKNYVQKLNNLGAKRICSAIFTTDESIGLQGLEKYKKEINTLNQFCDNILCFSIEDIGNISVKNLENIIPLSPISATLTWNYQNEYGGGAKCEAGLTENGFYACKLFEQNNIFVDTAHMSEKSFYDFCKITTRPIFNSHCNIYSIFNNPRNLKDDQIRQIVSSNGFIGITFYQKFISNRQISCKDLAKQFEYLADRFGCDNLGIGSDLFGFDEKYLPKDLKSYRNLTNLKNELEILGFSQNDIKKLFYQNFLNILTKR